MTLDFDCDLCQSDQWFGAEGSCDPINLTCICPEGFSGKDDFLTFSACQVNDNLRKIIHILFFAISIFGLLACIISFILLARKWRFSLSLLSFQTQESDERPGTESRDDFERSSSLSLFTPPDVRPRRTSIVQKDLIFRNWKRKQYTLLALLSILIFYIGGIMFNFPMIRGDNRQDEKLLVSLGFFLVTLGGTPAVAFLILIWYYALPDVSKYGALLKVNNLFVKYPGFFPKAVRRKAILDSTIFCITSLVIPLSDVTDEVRFYADLMTTLMFLSGSFTNATGLVVVMNSVEKIFGMAVATFEHPRATAFDKSREFEVKMMKLALKPIRKAKVVCAGMMLFVTVLAIVTLSRGVCEYYVFFNVGFMAFSLFMFSAPVSFVMFDDYLSPKRSKPRLNPNK